MNGNTTLHLWEKRGMDYSIHIEELVRFLREERAGFALSERLLSCGTRAGLCAKSAAKRTGTRREEAVREAAEQIREADYIIEMAVKSGYLTKRQGATIREEAAALLAELENCVTAGGKNGVEKAGEG